MDLSSVNLLRKSCSTVSILLALWLIILSSQPKCARSLVPLLQRMVSMPMWRLVLALKALLSTLVLRMVPLKAVWREPCPPREAHDAGGILLLHLVAIVATAAIMETPTIPTPMMDATAPVMQVGAEATAPLTFAARKAIVVVMDQHRT